MLAKTPAAAAFGQAIQKAGRCEKEYLFLAARQGSKQKWEVKSHVDGALATTRFEKVGPAGKFFLYRAFIVSGRKHQIRRHAKESGIPILGDQDYGGAPYPRLCLHCRRVNWPEVGEVMAPTPASMGNLGDFADDPGFLVSFDRRLKFYDGVTDAFRCVHRGEMRRLDCAIDFYAGFLRVWLYDEEASPRDAQELLKPHLKKLMSRYGARGGVIRGIQKNPHDRGLAEGCEIFGDAPPESFEATERDLKFRVTLTTDQHAGLFCDQRDNRERLKRMAGGKRVANLFSYTCSFSLAAAAGGCREVVSVDAAAPCLATGRGNFVANGRDGDAVKFIQEDAREWLSRQGRRVARDGAAARYDLIVCDPPTFSTTKSGGKFSVAKEWGDLVRFCRDILADDGWILFCTNHREGTRDAYAAVLNECFSVVRPTPAPLDFPVIDPKLEHVKMFWCGV